MSDLHRQIFVAEYSALRAAGDEVLDDEDAEHGLLELAAYVGLGCELRSIS